eukprot:s5743_g2.t1
MLLRAWVWRLRDALAPSKTDAARVAVDDRTRSYMVFTLSDALAGLDAAYMVFALSDALAGLDAAAARCAGSWQDGSVASILCDFFSLAHHPVSGRGSFHMSKWA